MSISCIDVRHRLNDMADSIIYAKRVVGEPKSLLLVGGDKSQPFYKSVIRAAKNAGVVQVDYAQEMGDTAYLNYNGILFDTSIELPKYDLGLLSAEQDIDCLTESSKHLSSCVAAACWCVLNQLDLLEGKHIAIIGRGHAARGLDKLCMRENATVTILHSHTPAIVTEMLTNPNYMPDVVINTAPNLEGKRLPARRLIIDVSGAYGSHYFGEAPVFTGIGPLTAALVIGRL